jgi:hypothetical protein
VDLRAPARRQLGTIGDPADLIVCDTMTIEGAAVHSAAPFHVRPAWASTWRWKSSRELVTASEANRRASDREAGVKEAGSEAAGRRTGTG